VRVPSFVGSTFQRPERPCRNSFLQYLLDDLDCRLRSKLLHHVGGVVVVAGHGTDIDVLLTGKKMGASLIKNMSAVQHKS
jgi:hypothetical protein